MKRWSCADNKIRAMDGGGRRRGRRRGRGGRVGRRRRSAAAAAARQAAQRGAHAAAAHPAAGRHCRRHRHALLAYQVTHIHQIKSAAAKRGAHAAALLLVATVAKPTDSLIKFSIYFVSLTEHLFWSNTSFSTSKRTQHYFI